MELINKRRNNGLYVEGDTLYKIFNKGYSKDDVFLEAFITSRVESLGINVFAIDEVYMKDDCWTYKSKYLPGKSLFQMMKEDPDNMDKYMTQLVQVQTSIHKHKCKHLPIQKQKLTDYINNSNLEDYEKIDLIDMLNSSPKHQKLCHNNFTPHNAVLVGDKFYITDWNHATLGNASADIARSYVWMMMNMPEYAELYLEKFCEATNTSSKYVHNWIPIVAAARLGKKYPGEEELLNSLISIIEY